MKTVLLKQDNDHSEQVGDKVVSLLCWIVLLELRNVSVMFPVSSKVHSKEGEGKEGEGDKGLSNEGKRDPCDELPEVVGAGDN